MPNTEAELRQFNKFNANKLKWTKGLQKVEAGNDQMEKKKAVQHNPTTGKHIQGSWQKIQSPKTGKFPSCFYFCRGEQ